MLSMKINREHAALKAQNSNKSFYRKIVFEIRRQLLKNLQLVLRRAIIDSQGEEE